MLGVGTRQGVGECLWVGVGDLMGDCLVGGLGRMGVGVRRDGDRV